MTFDSIEELVEAANGAYGPEEAHEAMAIVGELQNYDWNFEGGDREDDDGDSFENALLDQIERYEDHLNKGVPSEHHRHLTESEILRIAEDARRNHEVPDLISQHQEGRGAADWGRTDAGRHEKGLEAVERAMAEQDSGGQLSGAGAES